MKNLKHLLIVAGLALGGAVQAQGSAASEDLLAPNANLVLQNVPPIPQRLVQRVAKYTDFRGHSFVDWHPTRREMPSTTLSACSNSSAIAAPRPRDVPVTMVM